MKQQKKKKFRERSLACNTFKVKGHDGTLGWD